ncbi:hypothetical protein EYF80_025402 [Liparis tanakae]|uniref:Uncharacterized protein n=1 Tax=Liparis tanakae TaxID=230148 RepID=A0A4Z2HFJ1_9TELE|nr:hypothetical protein EYF80_025402 [Liparis tanakae]
MRWAAVIVSVSFISIPSTISRAMPEAYASMHPLLPHEHSGPSNETMMWPSSAAQKTGRCSASEMGVLRSTEDHSWISFVECRTTPSWGFTRPPVDGQSALCLQDVIDVLGDAVFYRGETERLLEGFIQVDDGRAKGARLSYATAAVSDHAAGVAHQLDELLKGNVLHCPEVGEWGLVT